MLRGHQADMISRMIPLLARMEKLECYHDEPIFKQWTVELKLIVELCEMSLGDDLPRHPQWIRLVTVAMLLCISWPFKLKHQELLAPFIERNDSVQADAQEEKEKGSKEDGSRKATTEADDTQGEHLTPSATPKLSHFGFEDIPLWKALATHFSSETAAAEIRKRENEAFVERQRLALVQRQIRPQPPAREDPSEPSPARRGGRIRRRA